MLPAKKTSAKKRLRRTPANKRVALLSEEETQFIQAYNQIEEMIATLKLAPSQVVSENMLSALLGFGRTPVREALQQLAREGLVVIMPRRGIVVADIDVRKQLRLLEMRRCIERGLVGLAAKRASEAERQAFLSLADEMESKRNDGKAFLLLDARMNQLLIDASRNEFAAASMKLVQGLSRRFWFAHYERAANLSETVRLHIAIARAVGKGSEKEAVKSLDALMDNVEAFTRATLDS